MPTGHRPVAESTVFPRSLLYVLQHHKLYETIARGVIGVAMLIKTMVCGIVINSVETTRKPTRVQLQMENK